MTFYNNNCYSPYIYMSIRIILIIIIIPKNIEEGQIVVFSLLANIKKSKINNRI